jgi:DNA-binding response OmpR family regulator
LYAEQAPFPFVFDVETVETVLVNLLSNALKFTPAGGTVEVTLALDDAGEGGVVLTVRDTGDGIAADHLPHVFDRFYQVDASATRKHEGAGIGLALVEQLVKLHGGTIHADSALGKGSTFTVTLPALQAPDGDALPNEPLTIATAPPAEPTAPPSDPAEETPDKPLVLVVEDNADMRALLGEHLAREYRVEQAGDGEHGLHRALDLVPDLVVSDVMMPRRDGFDLLAALKADIRTSHIPVVLLTARADAESRLKGIGRGADGYLAKPFARLELLALLRNLIDGRNRLRERWQAAPGLTPAQLELPSEEQVFLEKVQALVEARMSDSAFGAAELADAVAMSPRQLRRKLNHLLGETPAALLRRFRVERAAALLDQQAGSIKDVAAATGFRSTSGFRAAFRDVLGSSPSDYAARSEG